MNEHPQINTAAYITVQICNACWNKENPNREPIRINPKMNTADTCFDCGELTKSGIFVRRLAK